MFIDVIELSVVSVFGVLPVTVLQKDIQSVSLILLFGKN